MAAHGLAEVETPGNQQRARMKEDLSAIFAAAKLMVEIEFVFVFVFEFAYVFLSIYAHMAKTINGTLK